MGKSSPQKKKEVYYDSRPLTESEIKSLKKEIKESHLIYQGLIKEN